MIECLGSNLGPKLSLQLFRFNGEGEGKTLLPRRVLSFKDAAFGFFQRQGTDVSVTLGMSLESNSFGLGEGKFKNCDQDNNNKFKSGHVVVVDDDPTGPLQLFVIHYYKFEVNAGVGFGVTGKF